MPDASTTIARTNEAAGKDRRLRCPGCSVPLRRHCADVECSYLVCVVERCPKPGCFDWLGLEWFSPTDALMVEHLMRTSWPR